MKQYLELLQHILSQGEKREDRTGTGTQSVFGYQLRFNLQEGFPLLSTKKLHIHSIIHELLWFLRGETHIRYLQENNVHIWDPWADKNQNIGPLYGAQWRNWNGSIDQINQVIQSIQQDPYSRRHIVSAWNVSELNQMALYPCHLLFQFYVSTQHQTLSCQLYQRSADVFLGLPFNIASYALLTLMIAQICKLHAGNLILTLGDAHLYTNHIAQAEIQRQRQPLQLPTMRLNPRQNINDFEYNDFHLENYQAHPHLPGNISV